MKNSLSEQKVKVEDKVPMDILYEYHFKTSKYGSLKEKIAAATYVGNERKVGTENRTQPYPFNEMKEFGTDNNYRWKIGNDFNLFDSDECFDKWEKRRLMFNLSFSEHDQKHPIHDELYEDKPNKHDNIGCLLYTSPSPRDS